MELDDFRKFWNQSEMRDASLLKERELLSKLDSYEKSGRSIRKAFLWEMLTIAVIYLGFIFVVIFLREGVESYMYKLVVVTLLGGLPVCYRLYKSQRWINNLDYSQDIKSNLEAFLVYYKTTLRLYQWCSYGTIGLLLILFFTDQAFLELDAALKAAIVIYMILFMLLTGPYIKKVYGNRVGSIEAFLKG